MGQVKEMQVESKAMEDPEKLKAEGNDSFKAGNYEEALVKYTRAIELSDKDSDKSTYLKNRAAVHLKKENYEKVVDDCTAALELTQNDPKVSNTSRHCVTKAVLTHVAMYTDFFW